MLRLALCSTGLSWAWLSLLVLGIDRYSKFWVLSNLNLHEPLPLLAFFNLTLAYNKGAAFSFLHQANGWQNILFCVLAFIICALIIVWLYRSKRQDYVTNIALTLIMGGALGNVLDRLTYGYVVDYFDFHIFTWHFAIFNIADAAICIGALLLILYWSRKNEKKSI